MDNVHYPYRNKIYVIKNVIYLVAFLEIFMITKLNVAALMVFSMSIVAAPEWVTVADGGEATVLLDPTSVAKTGELVSIQILQKYDQLITLGNDPTTNEMLYRHRSVKPDDSANCESGKLSLESWQMFSSNYGTGETVWIDKELGAPAFMATSGPEESSALRAACSSRVSTVSATPIKS